LEKVIIKATERSEKLNKVRKAGFLPGVLNGPGTASTTVQFDNIAMNKIISKHGMNAKMWVELGAEEKFGFIKEIQRNPVAGNVIHVAIQMVSKDQVVKMLLPINFHGSGELKHRLLNMQVYKPEVEIEGITALLPDAAVVDVSERKAGDNITAVDFNFPPEIKVLDAEHEIYAIIRGLREEVAEEPEAAKEAKK